MLRTILLASAAAVFATFSTGAVASAHGHHHFHHAYMSDNDMLVGTNDDDQDIAYVAEPVYYVPAQSVAIYQPAYIPANDAIVTPYGYTPYYDNGYYQGYGYNPGYAYNPYYMGAAYGNGDPLSAAVVNTVLGVVGNGGGVNSGQMLQTLIGAFLAAQAQQQYQQQPYYPPQYAPQYVPQYVPQYIPQAVQQYVPQQYVPQYVPQVQYGPGYGRDWHEHGEHRDHGDRD